MAWTDSHTIDLDFLTDFIVRAKAHTYAGSGGAVAPSRPGSHDLQFSDGAFTYIDTYVGGADFLGQELVLIDAAPVWAMNYYGHLVTACWTMTSRCRPGTGAAVRTGCPQ